MSGFRLLDLVKFFLPILPEIESPVETVELDEKIIYTVSSGIIFLLGQLPIYGLTSDANSKISDPFYFFREVFIMEKGTLLELGLLPVITSVFFWQLCAGLRMINVNFNSRSDRELFQSAQKLTSLFLAIIYGIGLITSGYYNNVIKGSALNYDYLPLGTSILILLQIVGNSFFVTSIIEILDKGYGFGSGILSLMALQVSMNLVKDIVGIEIVSLPNSNKSESVGALMNLIRNFSFSPKEIATNVANSFTRSSLPNLSHVYLAAATILVTVYFQNFRIEIPIRSTKVRGMNNVFPIRLLYTGTLPVLFAYTVIANVQVLGFLIASNLKQYSPVASSIIGNWNLDSKSLHLGLSSGVLYFFSPSTNFLQSVVSPLRTIVFGASVLIMSTWFGDKWCLISGFSPKDISKQFKEQGISIAGKRDISVTKELSRVIPVASVSGAFIVAAVAVVTDILGASGKEAAVLIGMNAAFGILEEFSVEFQQAGGSSQFTNAFR